jgi:hypothetical protein
VRAVEPSKSPLFKKVGPNLYRTAAGRYYGLVKRGGKQFRRSLHTLDHALARRRLREFQAEKIIKFARLSFFDLLRPVPSSFKRVTGKVG